MIYVLIPHTAQDWEHSRIFLTYAMVEQIALRTAQQLVREGRDEDWCSITGYDGVDEVHPRFLYWVGGGRLQREPVPSPSP